jgi:hypothetical protein
LGFFWRKLQRTGGSKKGPGQGGVREPAFSVAVIDYYMSETDLRFLRSAAVVIYRNRRLFESAENHTVTNRRRRPWEPPVIISSPPSPPFFSDNRPTHWGWIINNAASRENKGNEKPAETKGDPATRKKTADLSPLLPAVLFGCVPLD